MGQLQVASACFHDCIEDQRVMLRIYFVFAGNCDVLYRKGIGIISVFY